MHPSRYSSPAKINWFLHITARLGNGYHSLETVFQKIDWCDQIDIVITDAPEVVLKGDLSDMPPEENLMYRAARALQLRADATWQAKGAVLTLQKNIPMGAGLGGGSSNAATVLNALNTLWQLHFSSDVLHELALSLGADVPFFLNDSTSAFASGIGEQLTAMNLPALELFLVKPAVHASTQAVYQHPLLVRNHPSLNLSVAELSARLPLLDAQSDLANDMQVAAFAIAPEIKQVYDALRQVVPDAYVRMSGSGATVFAFVRTAQQRAALQQWQTQAPAHWQQQWCHTLG